MNLSCCRATRSSLLLLVSRTHTAIRPPGESCRQRHVRDYSDVYGQETKRNGGALDGIKVIDLSRVLAGPFCGQILADYGADVIKIEDVGKGDDTRYWTVKGEKQAWNPGAGPMSTYFASINRNKRAMRLDLKQDKGREILLDLVRQSDVLLENFKGGTMEKLQLDYKVLKEVNPRLIHATITGYGASGPYATKAGYDMMVGAEAGLLHLTGERNGPPVRAGLGLTDMSTGLFCHGAIMAALYAREKTGRGQKIDTSLFESQIALLTNVGMSWLNLGREGERWGTQHPSIVPYDAFKSSDDAYLVCGATNDRQFHMMCQVLDLDDLPSDPRFKSNADRIENREKLYALLNEAFSQKTLSQWIEIFETTSLPFASINNMEKVFAHPQTHARDMVQALDCEDITGGKLKIIGPAVKFGETSVTIRRPPPRLGQHSKEILEELGASPETIAELIRLEVI